MEVYCWWIGKSNWSVYLDRCKAFDTLPQDILVFKFGRQGFEVWFNWGTIGRIAVSISMFKWRQVTNVIPQELVLEVLWFGIFAGDMDSETESILSKFFSDTKMCGVTDMKAGHPEGPSQAWEVQPWEHEVQQGQVQGHPQRLSEGWNTSAMRTDYGCLCCLA